MEIILGTFILVVIVAALVIIATSANTKPTQKSPYSYTASKHIMTPSEEDFFHLLSEAVSEKYLVFPQIHLSAFLNHEIPGQSWTNAFRHINQKSIDYALCDKRTLELIYAIELDDYTHRLYKNRFDRDTEVERILSEAKIPLVRFKNYTELTHEKIIAKLSAVYISNQS